MTILMIESFDNYSISSATTVMSLGRRYTIPSTATYSYVSLVNGYKSNGLALQSAAINNANNQFSYNFTTNHGTTYTEITAGFHYKTDGAITNVIQFQSTNGTAYVGLNINLNSKLTIFLPGTANTAPTVGLEAPSDVMLLNTWVYIEAHITITGTTANVEIFKDGRSVLVQTGITWYSGTSTGPQTLDNVVFGKTAYGLLSPQKIIAYDNVYITTGERLGPQVITTLKPSADTAQKQWTPSTGTSNYSVVLKDVASLVSTPYVSASTINLKDYYEMTDLYNDIGLITAIQPYAHAISNVANTEQIRVNINTGGTEIFGVARLLPNSNTVMARANVVSINPATSAAWTAAQINSIQVGVERTV